jgi:uncharacterized protein (TIGR03437 family)
MRLLTLMLAAGSAWAQTASYPTTVQIPAGEFAMGDHHNFVDPAHPSDELPIHKVWIDALHVGVYDVTNRQYIEFLNAAYAQGLIEVRNGMVYRKGSSDAYCETRTMSDYSAIAWDGTAFTLADFRGNHPAVGIRWHGAAAYTNWLSQAQGYQPCYDTATWKCDFTRNGFRLPTEAEWEYAARGGQYTPYRNFPWGDDIDNAKANWQDSRDPYETGPSPWTTPVGFYDGKLKLKSDYGWPGSQTSYQTASGVNGFGLYDMSGNVWQWCHDWYNRDYYAVSPAKNPPGPDTASPMPDGLFYRVMRGGNWYNGDPGDPGHGRVSNRDPGYFRGPQDPNHPYYHVGFRVVRPAAVGSGVSVASAASYSGAAVAPASIAAAFASGIGGGTVSVRDSAGVERAAQVVGSAAGQINFVVPPATAAGPATITISNAGAVKSGTVLVESVAPGLFSANGDGKGVAAGVALRIAADGTQSSQYLFEDSGGAQRGLAVDVSRAGESVILLLFGTGMRGMTQRATATVSGASVAVAGPAAQGEFPGLDQVNLGPLPASLAGRGEIAINVTVDGKTANPVTVTIR